MPSVSKKQAIAMKIAAKGKGKLGIPKKIGEEFAEGDRRRDSMKEERLERGHGPFSLPRKARK